jgi:nucleoside-diphosphate kinase
MTHYSQEQTLVVIKPDGLQRSLVGDIIKRIEQTGLKLVALKLVQPTEIFVTDFYTLDNDWLENVGTKAIAAYVDKGKTPPTENPLEAGQVILDRLKKYITTSPVVAMVWQGMNAVAVGQKITGTTEPLSSDVGTIRGDFVIDSYGAANGENRAVRNVVHRSGSIEEAKMEIALWFKKEEVLEYRLVQEEILYDVNIDGKDE